MPTSTTLPPLADLAADLAPHAALIAEQIIGAKPTSHTGREARFRTRGSLSVITIGKNRGAFYDHEAGIGGDALALIAHTRRCSVGEAARWGRAFLGISPAGADRHSRNVVPKAEVQPPVAPTRSSTLDLARSIWREAVPAAETAVEVYLRSRHLALSANAPLRFHPHCPRGKERLPAMVALMTDPTTGQPCGVHRTFLTPDGSGKADGAARMMAGHAGVIRLAPADNEATDLGLAEGIETALSIGQLFGWSPIWAATSAGGITRFPLLAGVDALTIFADPDPAGMKAAHSAAERWRAAGREASFVTPPAGIGDFNDAMRLHREGRR